MKQQTGAALLTAMVSLLLVTIMGVIAMKGSGLENKVANNHASSKQVFNAVQGAVNYIFTRETAEGLRTALNQPGQTTNDTNNLFVIDGIDVDLVTRLFYIDSSGSSCRSYGESTQGTSGGGDTKVCYGFRNTASAELDNGANSAVQIGFYASR